MPSEALSIALADAAAGSSIESSSCPAVAWWKLFDDAQLSFLVETALEKNPSLQSAYNKILLAAANADRVKSLLFPKLFWAADTSRQKLSETGIVPFHQVPPGLAGPAPAQ